MIRFPYRWTFRYALKNLDHALWDIRNGMSNLWKFKSAVWWYRGWDYTGLLGLIEVAARDMRDGHKNYSLHVGAERAVKQLTIVAELCKRISADDYYETANHSGKPYEELNDTEKKVLFRRCADVEKQDVQYLGKMFRYMREWWR